MKTKIALAVLAVNLFALDYGAYRVDSAFRMYRAAICPAERTRPVAAPANHSQYEFDAITYIGGDVMLVRLENSKPAKYIHFYGCDANGHRYRIWIEGR